MFWLLVVASIATPEAITEFAQAWRTANLADLTDSLRGLFHLVAMVSVMTVGVVMRHRLSLRLPQPLRRGRRAHDSPAVQYTYRG